MAGSQILTPHLPADPGSYAILLYLPGLARIGVGRLGSFDFPPGQYLYLGSAHGPGGLKARLAHHLRSAARPHWHIDFLRTYAEIQRIWWAVGQEPLECTWSQILIRMQGAFLPVPGFGASDCRRGCASHLIRLAERVTVEDITGVLNQAAPTALVQGWTKE